MNGVRVAPRISVVVLTYNRCDEVRRTLRRLAALPGDPPVLVVDNGCTDGTALCVEREFPRAVLIRAGANLGAAGRNLGVERAQTPYVAFCDDDTWWDPGSLELAADILDAHVDLAVLNASIRVGEEEKPDPASTAMAQSPLSDILGVGPELTGFMAGACVMRTSVFLEAGGYWRPLFIGGEETLLALDIMAQGWRIAYAPALRVHHWPSLARDHPLRLRMLARNALWTAWLRLPAGLAIRRSGYVLRGLPGWAARARAGRDALAGWRLIRRHRRPVDAGICDKLRQTWLAESGS
ncbi:glycosyltransferase family 2 protein [Achromobacter denitrificans]|uniref:glycosyltransferase family 2 protein n=1 Tax=Achromobacter denitrificans TaxID=32002 RepID=UPI001E537516|nr:glycosyltransferase [Achromobacter denitrificans]